MHTYRHAPSQPVAVPLYAQQEAPPRCSLWARDDVHRRRAGARGDLRALIAERRRLRRPQCPPPLCFRPPVLAPREGSVAARQHSWAAWRRGRAARCDAANAALREVGAAYPRQAEAVRGISRLWTNLANRSEEHTSELQSLMRS